jgi:2-polyprenyl-6-methoxyphenol hydroxylase-like FAD-dependent oxidoreductase
VYFSRHFRNTTGSLPATLGPLLQHFGSLSVLTLPADHGTWGVGLIASAGDRALLRLRDPDRWTAVARALTPIAHWVDGDPITGVQVLNRLEDRRRRLVVGGQPVATGIVAVADACASTNPTLGRGIPLGLTHALCLRDLLRAHSVDDPGGFVLAWDDVTETNLTPAYRAVVAADRHRLGEINAAIDGTEYRTDDLAWQAYRALETVAHHDPDLLRGWFRIAGLVASGTEVFSAPGLLARLSAVLAEHSIDRAGPDLSRARLLDLVSGGGP